MANVKCSSRIENNAAKLDPTGYGERNKMMRRILWEGGGRGVMGILRLWVAWVAWVGEFNYMSFKRESNSGRRYTR